MKLRIHHKITLAILFLVLCMLSGIYVYLQTFLTDHTYARIQRSLQKEISLAKTLAEQVLKPETMDMQADMLADQIGHDLQVRVTLIGLDGVVLGDSELKQEEVDAIENHSDRPEIKGAFTYGLGQSRRFSTTIKQELLYMATTFGEPEAQGILRLSIPLAAIDEVHAHVRRVIFLALVIAFILAIVYSLCISLLISRPITEMAFMAKGISCGNYMQKINIQTHDEIMDLATAFNHMAQQIKIRIDEITDNKHRLEAILLSMFDGVMVVNNVGSITLMNLSLKNALNITVDVTGRKPIEIIRNTDMQDIVDTVLQHGEAVETRELTLKVPTERIFLVHATPIFRENRGCGAVLVFHDITAIKQLEHLRRDFVANVSHELRTPLASINGYAETLLHGAIDDRENAQQFVQIIYDDAQRLTILVNDLLDLAKIESGKLSLTLVPVSLLSIVSQACERFTRTAEMHNITLSSDIPVDTPNILADEARIMQVFINLIDNAIKYTPAGGRISVNVSQYENLIQVSITDTGFGIPEEDLPRVFERFYRVDKARSRKLGGTGLGLAIVKHLVQAHNGTVRAKSILGQGSTFIFTIPIA